MEINLQFIKCDLINENEITASFCVRWICLLDSCTYQQFTKGNINMTKNECTLVLADPCWI